MLFEYLKTDRQTDTTPLQDHPEECTSAYCHSRAFRIACSLTHCLGTCRHVNRRLHSAVSFSSAHRAPTHVTAGALTCHSSNQGTPKCCWGGRPRDCSSCHVAPCIVTAAVMLVPAAFLQLLCLATLCAIHFLSMLLHVCVFALPVRLRLTCPTIAVHRGVVAWFHKAALQYGRKMVIMTHHSSICERHCCRQLWQCVLEWAAPVKRHNTWLFLSCTAWSLCVRIHKHYCCGIHIYMYMHIHVHTYS